MKNMAKHSLKWNIFSAENINFNTLKLYSISLLNFDVKQHFHYQWKKELSLLAFHGGNVHFRLIPLKIFSLGSELKFWPLKWNIFDPKICESRNLDPKNGTFWPPKKAKIFDKNGKKCWLSQILPNLSKLAWIWPNLEKNN